MSIGIYISALGKAEREIKRLNEATKCAERNLKKVELALIFKEELISFMVEKRKSHVHIRDEYLVDEDLLEALLNAEGIKLGKERGLTKVFTGELNEVPMTNCPTFRPSFAN